MKNDIVLEKQINVNVAASNYIKEIASWTTFLSIVGFVGIGFLVIFAFLMKFVLGDAFIKAATNQEMPFEMQNFLATLYLIIAFIYYFPILYLYKFSIKMKNALQEKDETIFTDALQMLKSHYKFMGVFTIIIISLYVLMFVAILIFGASLM